MHSVPLCSKESTENRTKLNPAPSVLHTSWDLCGASTVGSIQWASAQGHWSRCHQDQSRLQHCVHGLSLSSPPLCTLLARSAPVCLALFTASPWQAGIGMGSLRLPASICLYKRAIQGLQRGLPSKVLAMQALGPEFNSPEPMFTKLVMGLARWPDS